jgi:hypothetical protein
MKRTAFFGIFAILTIGLLTLVSSGSDLEKTISYVRLFPDESEISHFEEVTFKLTADDVQSPAVPFFFSSFEKATSFGYYSTSAGYFDDWHNAPRHQFLFCLAGEFELQASDGEKRRFEQGSILLVEDTTDKGHKGRVIGSDDVLMIVVTLE